MPRLLFCVLVFTASYAVASDRHKSSLTFVIDDTGSMYDDIAEVKLGANAIFDTVLRSNASQIEKFVLVTFNDDGKGDPGVVVRANTQSREVFRNALSGITIRGGYDCPEYAMTGIKTALEESLDRSSLYVFTDASAKDYADFEEVKAFAQKKQSQVIFVLTGKCNEYAREPDYQVYHDMAQATGGEVFHAQKGQVGKVLEFVKKTITGRRTTLVTEKLPPGKHNMTFDVDVVMGELTLSLASTETNDPSVTIKAPDGSEVWKKILFETDQTQVYSIDVTMPGTHTVEVNSKAETRAVVSARSGVDFEHGFSAYKLPSLVDTKTRPPPGTKSHLSIKLNEGDIVLHTIQILDMDDNVKLEVPLEILDKGTKFYTTRAFDPPETMFKIATRVATANNRQACSILGLSVAFYQMSCGQKQAHSIIGTDPNSGSNITRMAPTPVEPQKVLPGKRIDNKGPVVVIEGGPVINAKYDNPLQLVCTVSGYPVPSVVWKNDKGTAISGEVSVSELPYDYMSVLAIEKVQENATYECEASNSVGFNAKHVTVTTVVLKKFNVLGTPKRIEVEYDKEGRISCKVDAYPPANITWYKNRVKLISNDHIDLSANNTILTIRHATPSDEGRYMCVARNTDQTKKIFKYVTVAGTESPEIDKDLSDISVKKGTSTVVECKILRGIPKPSIRWYHAKNGNVQQAVEIEEWKDKERAAVIVSDESDAGSYQCEAKNDLSSDFHEIILHLEYPPTITRSVKHITATPGSRVSIPCHATGGPQPNVTWYKNEVEITTSARAKIFGDQTLRLVVKPKDSGYYTCAATNAFGSVNKTVKVEVKVPATINPPTQSELYVLVGRSLTLPCEARGDPKPHVEWIYRSFNTPSTSKTITSAEVLELERIQVAEGGYYTCVARNIVGSANVTYEVKVLAPPFIKNRYLTKHFEAVQGDQALRLACEASGNPQPTITWTKDGLNLDLDSTFYTEEGTLIINNVPKNANGTYTCKATNSLGTVQENYDVTVHEYPPLSRSLRLFMYIEKDRPAEILCAAPQKDYLNRIRWYKNGIFIKSGRLILTNPSVVDSGEYTCRVGDMFKSVSGTTIVIFGSKPVFTTTSEDENIDVMERPISLNCENSGVPTPEVEWYLDDTKLTVTESEYYFTAERISPGQYRCMVKNIIGNITKTFKVTERDCFVNTKKLTSLQPLMLTSSLEWPILKKSDEFMIFQKGEQFILVCPTKFQMFPNKYITAFCDGGMNILVTGESYNYSDIRCTEEVNHAVQRTGVNCMPGNTERVSIGYNVFDRQYAEVYEICLNRTSETPIYAKQTMQSYLADAEYKADWSDIDQFLMNFEDVYSCNYQINTISAQLGRWFHYEDKCCFSKRQLVSSRDVFPGPQQKSTFSYFNVIPHWSSCNADNWDEIERRVRNFAKNAISSLLVWTGVAEELSLKSVRGMTSRLVSDRRGTQLPIPMFLWKVIQDPESMTSLAIIQVNVPDLTPEAATRYVLCRDQCDRVNWMKNLDWHDVKKGYTYCCTLEEFEAAFGFGRIFEPNMTPLLTSEAYENFIPESSFLSA